jgi:hypothetical protein
MKQRVRNSSRHCGMTVRWTARLRNGDLIHYNNKKKGIDDAEAAPPPVVRIKP